MAAFAIPAAFAVAGFAAQQATKGSSGLPRSQIRDQARGSFVGFGQRTPTTTTSTVPDSLAFREDDRGKLRRIFTPQTKTTLGNTFTPTLATGGFSAGLVGGDDPLGLDFRVSPERDALIQDQSQKFLDLASDLEGLRQQLVTGFDSFRQRGLANIENERRRTIGSLSDNLARRRVLGSSFSNASIANSEAEFARRKADFNAAATLQEVEASRQFIERQNEATRLANQTILDELNLRTNIILSLSGKTQAATTALTTTQLEIAARAEENQQEGIGELFGSVGGLIGQAFGGGP